MNIGKNDLCPCGSGKKYKKCCLEKDKMEESRQLTDAFDEDNELDKWQPEEKEDNDFRVRKDFFEDMDDDFSEEGDEDTAFFEDIEKEDDLGFMSNKVPGISEKKQKSFQEAITERFTNYYAKYKDAGPEMLSFKKFPLWT